MYTIVPIVRFNFKGSFFYRCNCKWSEESFYCPICKLGAVKVDEKKCDDPIGKALSQTRDEWYERHD